MKPRAVSARVYRHHLVRSRFAPLPWLRLFGLLALLSPVYAAMQGLLDIEGMTRAEVRVIGGMSSTIQGAAPPADRPIERSPYVTARAEGAPSAHPLPEGTAAPPSRFETSGIAEATRIMTERGSPPLGVARGSTPAPTMSADIRPDTSAGLARHQAPYAPSRGGAWSLGWIR